MRAFASSWRSPIPILALGIFGLASSVAYSRTPDPAPPGSAVDAGLGRFRALAPGVEVTIKPDIKPSELISRHDLVEILAKDPEFRERPNTKGLSPARNTRFDHKIWALEFTFKPIRFVEVDLPNGLGQMERKLIWYLIYRVKNTSQDPVKFVPVFELRGLTRDTPDTLKLYPDNLLPLAIPAIERREDAGRRLLNVEKVLPDKPTRLLSTFDVVGEIAPGAEVWGVATWADVDPATDRFSILIRGLTNAYIWDDAKTNAGPPPTYEYRLGEPLGAHRTFAYKSLQLNFWRPSDVRYQHEQEIRYGVPDRDFGVPGKDAVDYKWVYRKNDGSVVDTGSATK